MKLHTKILILVILFGFRGVLRLIDIVGAIAEGASLLDKLIDAGSMFFIAYVLYAKREKWAYWIAVVFAGIALARSLLAISILFTDSSFPSFILVLVIVNAIAFGIIPLILLSNKELRDSFLEKK